jgi:hypothetical protein
MNTEFYFSAMPSPSKAEIVLFLETRQWLHPDASPNDALYMFTGLWLHPLWVREWDFPAGVDNYLW